MKNNLDTKSIKEILKQEKICKYNLEFIDRIMSAPQPEECWSEDAEFYMDKPGFEWFRKVWDNLCMPVFKKDPKDKEEVKIPKIKIKRCDVWEEPWKNYENCCPEPEYSVLILQNQVRWLIWFDLDRLPVHWSLEMAILWFIVIISTFTFKPN